LTVEAIDFAFMGAMEAEVAAILRHAVLLKQEQWLGLALHHVAWLGRRCIVVRCGVGKVFAAMTAQHLIDRYHPRAMVFTGVAGALNPEWEIGDVVVGSELIQHDVDGRALGFERGRLLYTDLKIFRSDPVLVSRAMKASLQGPALRQGRILTGDQFLSRESIHGRDYLTGELAGDAVEMEGAALAQVCSLNDIPFLVVRTLSDRADGDAVKDFTAFLPVVAQNTLAVLQSLLVQ